MPGDIVDFETKNIQIPDGITEVWQRIVDSVAIFLSVPGVMINRMVPPDLEIFRANMSPLTPLPSGTSIPMEGLYCTHVAIRREKLRVRDATMDKFWAESPTAKSGIISYLGVPVVWPDGVIFGTICAVDTCRNEWGDKAEHLLQTLKDVIESHLALIVSGTDLTTACVDLEPAINRVLAIHGFALLTPASGKSMDNTAGEKNGAGV